MNEQNRCNQCGAELGADAPQGLCPACLLKRALETQSAMSDVSGPVNNADFTPPTPAELADYFPELEILDFIGRGGMGMVYKARQKQLDRLVALKILLPKIGKDPAFAERFTREARAMALLSHPHVVAVHDFGQTSSPLAPLGRGTQRVPGSEGTLYYFLMEFVDGVSLRQLLDSGKLEPKEALAIVPQICEALQYAHDNGVVHRDIKPENILLDKRGRVKIADFGIAKLVARQGQDITLTGAGQVMGTPQYMAPEQMEHPQEVDHRADIYSLGVVFYQMLTGELPIGRFAPPSKKVHIDVRLDEVVLRALEKEPEQRYQQASEIKTHVETILTTPPRKSATGSASALSPDDAAIKQTQCQVKGSAIGLLVMGMINCIIIPLVILVFTAKIELNPPPPPPMILILASLAVFILVSLSPGTFTIFAALKMMRLKAYILAVAASILTIIASPAFFFIGLPIGIWALVVLNQREVRAAFGQQRSKKAGNHTIPKAIMRFLAVVAACILGMVIIWQCGFWPWDIPDAPRQEWRAASKSSSPAIDHVLIEGRKAVIEGLGSQDFIIRFELAGGFEQCGFYKNNPFTATLKWATWRGGLDIVVVDADGNLSLTAHTTAIGYVPFQTNRIFFREGPLQPEPDGSFVIADIRSDSGEKLPFTVRLLKKSKETFPEGAGETLNPIAQALEDYRQTLAVYDLGFDSVFPKQKWTHYDAARLEKYPTKDAWPHVLGHVDKNPNSFKIIQGDSQLQSKTIIGPNAFMIPLDRDLVTEAYVTLLFLKGIMSNGKVVATSYTSLVCLGEMDGWLNFDSYATALIKGDLSGQITSQSYFNLVVTGKFSGRIYADSYAMMYLMGGCEGSLELKNGARVYIAGRTVKADLSRITGRGEVFLEDSDLAPGEHRIGDLTVTVGKQEAQSDSTNEQAASGEDASQLLQQGWRLFFRDRQRDQAAAKFNEAVKIEPNDANAWNGLGWASFNSGKLQEAEKALQQAIALNPKHWGALNGLGQLYLSQKKYDLAETYLLKAAPQAPDAWFGLARLYLLQGKFDEAEKWAQKSTDTDQGNELTRETARRMLEAAKEKHLSEGLRIVIEPHSVESHLTDPADLLESPPESQMKPDIQHN